MAERSLYHTYVRNENGLVGESYVEGNQGLALGVSSSLIDAPGTNPEQFIAFALSTCFNATIRIVQHRECPVAKLLKENENVSFRIVDDFTDEPTLGE